MISHGAAGLFLPLFALASGGLRNPWAFTLAALFLWGAASRSRLPRIPFAPLWGAWLAWSAFSAVTSAEPWRGLSDLAYRVAGLGIFSLALNATEEDKKSWRLIALAAFPLIEICAILISIESYPNTGVLYPYYNYTGAVAAVGAAFGLASTFSKEEGESPLAILCTLASWGWLLWAGSRGGLLAASVGSIFVLMRCEKKWVAGTFAGICAVGFLGLFLTGSPILKLHKMESNLRPQLWTSAIKIANDSPILGEGPGQFDRGFLRHNFPAPKGTGLTRYGRVSAHAHSELLQEAAETGWPGAFLLAIAILATLGGAWTRKRPDAGALGGAFALLTQGLFDNIFALPALEWMFFSFLGAASASEDESKIQFPPAWVVAGIMLSSVAWWPRWFVNSARTQATGISILRAVSITPKDHRLWADLARINLKNGDARRTVSSLEIASRLHPTEAVYPLMIAQIAWTHKNWKAVLRITDRVLQLEPTAPQPRLLRAYALLELKRNDEARFEFELFKKVAQPLPTIAPYGPNVRFILGHEAKLRRAIQKRLNPSLPQ